MEVWKDIPGYDGRYQVSSLGNVRSLHWNNQCIVKNLTPAIDKRGYLRFRLSKHNKVKAFLAHRLVAEAFIQNAENKPQVNHINGIKTDNKVDNLEWCTNSENAIHAFSCGLKPTRTVCQYDKQMQFIKEWHSLSDVGRELNINPSNIVECCIGKRRTAGSYMWRYKETD